MEDRIRRVICAFDAQGQHRTGTQVDSASAGWFAGELAQAGPLTAVETYRFRRLVPAEAFVEVAGRRIEGLPLFDSPPTAPDGVGGVFGTGTSEIALLPAPSQRSQLEGLRNSPVAGIVVPTVGVRLGLAPINAESFRRPFGRPVLQVSGAALPALQEAAAGGERARLVSSFTFEETVASNVTGIVPGADPGLPPLGVMTPRSGWWECASERGGGIACLLEVARAVVASKPRRTVVFVGTTGHELGHWGLEEFLARRPGLAPGAALWIHLGASIGAALDPRGMIYASRPSLAGEALQALDGAGAALPSLPPEGAVGPGESKNIHEAGGEYVSLAGGSAVFHLQQDRWPDAVDVKQVAAVAQGMAAFAVRVANS